MSMEDIVMEDLAEETTALLKTLAHPARLIICCQLKRQEMSVGEMEKKLQIKQPNLSRELAKLRAEGFVETRRESKVIFYRLAQTPRIGRMLEAICAVMRDQPAPAYNLPSPSARTGSDGGSGVFARPLMAPQVTAQGDRG